MRGLLPSVAMAILTSIALPIMLIYEPAQDAFDSGLGDYVTAIASIIAQQSSDRPRINPEAELVLKTDTGGEVFYAIVGTDGAVRAGDGFLAQKPRPITKEDPWIYDDVYQGQPIRVYARFAPCGTSRCEIRVAETVQRRWDLFKDILLVGVVPVLLLGALLILVVYLAVRRSIVPLETYTKHIRTFSSSGWQPIAAEETFEEIRPMVRALNEAVVSLKIAIDSQQQFLSTAAHQLRTPLAGLRGAADLARLTKDPEALDRQLEKLSDSADRVARLATQLLVLARAEPHVQHAEDMGDTDLSLLAQDLMDEYLHLANQRGIDLGFELHPAPLFGHRILLRELMANLLDNALRYTPDGGRVTLRTGVDFEPNAKAWVEVEDSGPGIPEAYRAFVLNRFARIPGVSGPGSGLGLAIVKEIVDAHKANLVLSDAQEGSDPPGLIVRIDFTESKLRRSAD